MRSRNAAALVTLCLAAAVTSWAGGDEFALRARLLALLVLRLVPLLAALSLHEWAHGYAAFLLGDATARERGRLTLDPRAHVDLVGLLLVPGLLSLVHAPFSLGWARPVPVDVSRLRRPRRDGAIVAAAGPGANLALALLLAAALRLSGIGAAGPGGAMAWGFVALNLGLALFNLLPLYPMDGGRLIASVLPVRIAAWLARHELAAFLAGLGLLLVLPMAGGLLGLDISPVGAIGRAVVHATDLLAGTPRWQLPLTPHG